MPQFKDLGEKIRRRVTTSVKDHGLKAANLSHVLASGYTVRIESFADWSIYNDIFVDQEYDPAIIPALSQGRADGPIIVDLGANVGFFTLRVAELMHRMGLRDSKLQMLLVEGSPSVFHVLTERLQSQPILQNRYRAVNGLVGQRAGTGMIYETAFHGLISTTPRRFSRAAQVDFVNLDQLCEAFPRIDLIKCDIEGAEQAFVTNYPELLRKTDSIVLEFHHPYISYKECARCLREAGLSKHEILVNKDIVTTEVFHR